MSIGNQNCIPVPTQVKLSLSCNPEVTVAYNGPFICIGAMLVVIESTIRGWCYSVGDCPLCEEIVVEVEFDYGDFKYNNILNLFPQSMGGPAATLHWIGADIEDWSARELPAYISAKRLIDSI